jgi:hypothetical protein
MIEEAFVIKDYLPFTFSSKSEQDYVDFLWDTFEVNCENEKYQFAFLAYHMLYMVAVYCDIWQITTFQPSDFQNALIGFSKDHENDLLNGTSPFIFSICSESNIFRFLKLIGCNNDDVGKLARIVKDRNDIAHANGQLKCNSLDLLSSRVDEINECLKKLQEHVGPIIIACFRDFLLNSWNKEKREYYQSEDQIREVLVHHGYFSQMDIKDCLQFNINDLKKDKHFKKIQSLFNDFQELYSN